MKINDRALVVHSTSSSTPTDKEGWLWKRGEVNRSFQKRYFVLKGNLVSAHARMINDQFV